MSDLEVKPSPAPAAGDSPAPASQPVPAIPEPPRKDISRTAIGMNVVLQTLVVFGIVLMVNYVGFRQFKRWDLSRNQKFALSTKTTNLLDHLENPVKAIVFFPQAQMLSGDVSSLLREYEYASKKKFTVEFVDPYRNLIRARELAEKYKFGESDNIVILDYKGKSKFVNAQDMADFDTSGQSMGQPPTVRAFKGEEAITTALQEITEDKQNKLYLLGGHGELALNSDQIDAFKQYTLRENIKIEPLTLNNVDAIPADATGLLLFGPKQDLSEREIQLIQGFWNDKKGRLFVLLNAAAKTPRLVEWLASQGVTPQGDRVLKTGTGLAMDENNQPTLKTNVIIGSPFADFPPASRPIVKELAGQNTQLMGATESLELDKTKMQTDKVRYTPLLVSGDGFWGENEYDPSANRQVYFDPKKDRMGPLVLAVAVEKGGLEDPRVKVDTARMIVVGNSGFLTNDGLRIADVGIDFALTSLNWIFNREQLAGIPPKAKEPMRLSLDETKLQRLALTVLVYIPGLVAVFGLLTWWQRRR